MQNHVYSWPALLLDVKGMLHILVVVHGRTLTIFDPASSEVKLHMPLSSLAKFSWDRRNVQLMRADFGPSGSALLSSPYCGEITRAVACAVTGLDTGVCTDQISVDVAGISTSNGVAHPHELVLEGDKLVHRANGKVFSSHYLTDVSDVHPISPAVSHMSTGDIIEVTYYNDHPYRFRPKSTYRDLLLAALQGRCYLYRYLLPLLAAGRQPTIQFVSPGPGAMPEGVTDGQISRPVPQQVVVGTVPLVFGLRDPNEPNSDTEYEMMYSEYDKL